MSYKVLVTPRTFGKTNDLPIRMLKDAGCELICNSSNRPFTVEELFTLIRDVDGIIVGLDPLNRDVLKQAGRLKVISKYGVGLDNIDLDTAFQKGILVTITPGTNSSAVAELAFALMLDVARNVSEQDRQIRQGIWGKYSGLELWGKTLGILGTGQIGKQLALRATGFNMSLLCYDLMPDRVWAAKIGARYLPLPEILSKADIISVHLPLNDATYHLISSEELSLLKDSAIIINTARGGIIAENALYDCLANHRIFGAGIDVFETEPLQNSSFAKLTNVVLTSHSGAHTEESALAMGRLAAQNLIDGLKGITPQYTVALNK